METSVFFLLVVLLIPVILFTAQPFIRKVRHGHGENQTLSVILAERDRILNAIQELDFDHSLGKIPEENYLVQRAQLVQSGVEILKKIDEHAGTIGKPKGKQLKFTDVLTDDEIEDMIMLRRSRHKEKTGGFCPHCGKTVLLSDRFCPKCGHSLK